MYVLLACMSVHYMYLLSAQGNRVTGGCKPSSGCWDLIQGALEEQPMFLTTEPSLLNPFFSHNLETWLITVLSLFIVTPKKECESRSTLKICIYL